MPQPNLLERALHDVCGRRVGRKSSVASAATDDDPRPVTAAGLLQTSRGRGARAAPTAGQPGVGPGGVAFGRTVRDREGAAGPEPGDRGPAPGLARDFVLTAGAVAARPATRSGPLQGQVSVFPTSHVVV